MTALPQPDLFHTLPTAPEGLVYRPDLISAAEEQALAREFEQLPFKPFQFHGYLGKRRVVSFGWRRDRPQFDEVVGLSLLSPCVLRFRRGRGDGWERRSLLAEPRSAFLLTGPARREWEHSIAAVGALRYSITFRRLSG